MSHRFRALWLACLVLGLAGCDQVSKAVASRTLAEGPKSLISGVLTLRYAENPGVAFSALRDIRPAVRRPLVMGLQLAALLLLVVFVWRRPPNTWMGRLGMAAVIAGALGNIVDRVVRGSVVDFIHLHGWPIFNVADVLIVAGMLAVMAGAVLERNRRFT